MSLRLYDENDIINIANTIREKTGSTDTYKVTDMAEAISTISGDDTKWLYDYLLENNVFFDMKNGDMVDSRGWGRTLTKMNDNKMYCCTLTKDDGYNTYAIICKSPDECEFSASEYYASLLFTEALTTSNGNTYYIGHMHGAVGNTGMRYYPANKGGEYFVIQSFYIGHLGDNGGTNLTWEKVFIETVVDYGLYNTKPQPSTNFFPYAPIQFKEIAFPGNDYIYTWEEPFSAKNINRDWEMSFNAVLTTSKTSDNPVVSFSNFGSMAYCFDIFFYSVTDLYVYTPTNSRIIGDGHGSEKRVYSDYTGARITIRKTGTDIITLVNDDVVANNSISDMSGANGCRLVLGYYHGDGGTYYFDSIIKNFKFEYLN